MDRQDSGGNMNKQDFCRELARRACLDEQQARVLTDIFLDILTDQMSAQQSVSFYGFGTFSTRSPEVSVPASVSSDGAGTSSAKCRPDFKPSWKLNRLVASEAEDPAKRSLRRRTILTEPLTVPKEKRPRGRPRKTERPQDTG